MVRQDTHEGETEKGERERISGSLSLRVVSAGEDPSWVRRVVPHWLRTWRTFPLRSHGRVALPCHGVRSGPTDPVRSPRHSGPVSAPSAQYDAGIQRVKAVPKIEMCNEMLCRQVVGVRVPFTISRVSKYSHAMF